MGYKLKTNVKHDGKDFAKGDACPKDLEKEFLNQGLLEEVKEAAAPKPAAKPEAKSEGK